MTNDMEEGLQLKLDFGKIKEIQAKTQTDVIPVAVQDVDTKEVLIIAYINKEALENSIKSRIATFWSTSRNELWIKGKTSGDTLDIIEILVNCEQNSLVYLVRPRKEGACHTKQNGKSRKSCYYRKIKLDKPNMMDFLPNTN
jgi:phosphoribosyl-AMP cyclohydrolase